MKVIDYFQFIDECSQMNDEEGYKVYDTLLKEELSKDELVDLILEFTHIVCKADLSLEELTNPFNEPVEEVNKNHLKIVH